jgi:hypothetical protein
VTNREQRVADDSDRSGKIAFTRRAVLAGGVAALAGGHAFGAEAKSLADIVASFDRERERRHVPSISVALVEAGRVSLVVRGHRNAARGERAWISRATSSLPTPVSPRMSTLMLLAATRAIVGATHGVGSLVPAARSIMHATTAKAGPPRKVPVNQRSARARARHALCSVAQDAQPPTRRRDLVGVTTWLRRLAAQATRRTAKSATFSRNSSPSWRGALPALRSP